MTLRLARTPSGVSPRHDPGGNARSRGLVLAVLVAQAFSVAACLAFCDKSHNRPLAAAPMAAAPSRSAAAPSRDPASKEPVPAGALQSYVLSAPDLRVALPVRLSEVSGVTAITDTEVGCVQDEEGVVFVYDLEQQKITREIVFGPPGDFEDLAWAGTRLFVLRSDGVLYEIQGLSGTPSVKGHVLRLPSSDIEGLCNDPGRNRLLVAPKSRLGRGKELKDTRAIFAFDLDRAILQPDPVLVLSVDAIWEFAERQGRHVPYQKKKSGGQPQALRFMPSAISICPATSEIFVVSAVDRVLVTFDRDGNVTGYASLDSRLFRQPEGITFLSNGDLVITNEAAGQQPTLLLFKRKGRSAALGRD